MPRPHATAERQVVDRWHPSRLLDTRTLAMAAAGLSAVGVAGLADAASEHDGPSRLDPVVAAEVLRLRTPILTHLAQALTAAGSEVVVCGLALLVLITLLVRRRIPQAVTFALAIGGSAALTVAVKLLVSRPRPGGVDRLGRWTPATPSPRVTP